MNGGLERGICKVIFCDRDSQVPLIRDEKLDIKLAYNKGSPSTLAVR
jgi:hypothetical protein